MYGGGPPVPVPVNKTVEPAQAVGVFAEIFKPGKGLTVMVRIPAPRQLRVVWAITEYTVVTTGDTTIEDALLPLLQE